MPAAVARTRDAGAAGGPVCASSPHVPASVGENPPCLRRRHAASGALTLPRANGPVRRRSARCRRLRRGCTCCCLSCFSTCSTSAFAPTSTRSARRGRPRACHATRSSHTSPPSSLPSAPLHSRRARREKGKAGVSTGRCGAIPIPRAVSQVLLIFHLCTSALSRPWVAVFIPIYVGWSVRLILALMRRRESTGHGSTVGVTLSVRRDLLRNDGLIAAVHARRRRWRSPQVLFNSQTLLISISLFGQGVMPFWLALWTVWLGMVRRTSGTNTHCAVCSHRRTRHPDCD